jgi:hypothetical protein
MTIPFKLTPPPPGWLDRFPDGDYTIGRGADPRGKPEISQKHGARTAQRKAGPARKMPARKRASRAAAE